MTPGLCPQPRKEGLASFELTAPGPWLLRGTDLRPSKRDATDWESDFTTLTFEVGPK